MFDIPTADDVEEVVINADVIDKNTPPIIVHSKGKKTEAEAPA
jgi:ATP-dependent protease Clp ATPase subunit